MQILKIFNDDIEGRSRVQLIQKDGQKYIEKIYYDLSDIYIVPDMIIGTLFKDYKYLTSYDKIYLRIEGNRACSVRQIKYYDGGDFYGKLFNSKIYSLDEVFRFINNLSDALYQMHRHNYIHCDLKTMNLFHDTENNCAVLGDFGLVNYKQFNPINLIHF